MLGAPFLFILISQQLVDNPPPHPFPSLTSLLTELSRIYPLVFFKPLFACATSDQEVAVVNHLCTLHVHAKYVQGYWVREVEMMCVALLKNPGGKVGETAGLRGVARLGQLVLLVELIGNVQNARRVKEAAANVWLSSLVRTGYILVIFTSHQILPPWMLSSL